MEEILKFTKTEEDNFIFPIKYLPRCFDNKDLLSNLDAILYDYENSVKLLEDNFIVENGKISGIKCLKNNIYNATKGSEPINYIISKPSGGNRIMSVVNPLFLIPLHQYILENKDSILYEQEASNEIFDAASHFYFQNGGFLVERTYDDFSFTFYQGHYYQNSYAFNMINRLKISNGKYYCLKIDISSFYNSIYTHTVSWFTKSDDIIVFNNLDYLNRTLNGNETKGIVIGPYTSSLFSELILSKVDRKLFDVFKNKNIYYQRYCDDYMIYSDSKETLELEILPFVEKELFNYKLDINYSKVSIVEFPFLEDEEDLTSVVERIASYYCNENDETKKVDRIIYELSKTIDRKYSDTNYVLSAINSWDKFELNSDNNIRIMLNFLINLIFRNNLVSKYSVDLILKIIDNNDYDATVIISEWILKRKNLSNNTKIITDIWLIYIIVFLNIKSVSVEKYLINLLGENQLLDILIFEYLFNNKLLSNFKNEIEEYLKKIEDDFNLRYGGNLRDCYLTKYWLLFYTNSIRWKIHEIKGFKNTIFKKCFLENVVNNHKREKEMNLILKMYNLNIQLFKI